MKKPSKSPSSKFDSLTVEELNSLTNVLYYFDYHHPEGKDWITGPAFGWMTYAFAKTLLEDARAENRPWMEQWHKDHSNDDWD